MRLRRSTVILAMACAVLTMLIGGADATAEPANDRACADASSFMVTAVPGAAETLVSFRVVRCGS
jgi:hypothetical protein